MTSSKAFLLFSNRIFPFLALPFLTVYWFNVGGIHFAALVLGLPFLFGYIAPGIGTNILKMWRFRGSWRIGNYYVHHGLIYAATIGFMMCAAFFKPANHDWLTMLGNIARGAGILGFLGWAHDTIAIREGEMEVYNNPWKCGASAEAIAAQYAPVCFSLLGASYAGIVTLGYHTLVLQNNPGSLWWLFPLGLAFMSAAISLPFLSWIREAVHKKT